MSKQKRLLGPDGKPLDVAKYRPKPEPTPDSPADFAQSRWVDMPRLFRLTFGTDANGGIRVGTQPVPDKKRDGDVGTLVIGRTSWIHVDEPDDHHAPVWDEAWSVNGLNGNSGCAQCRERIVWFEDKAPLRSVVKDQLAAIHDALPDDWQGHVEVEPVPAELTDTYAVAFGSAVKNCEHKSSHSTLHARHERQCDDCGRYFTRKEWWES